MLLMTIAGLMYKKMLYIYAKKYNCIKPVKKTNNNVLNHYVEM